jgi:tyrosine-protein kinase
MRRPRVHEFFGLENRVGFTSVLLGNASVSDAIQNVPGELTIGLVASGPIPPNPAELLESRRAVETIEALENRCDLLLIDSPPVLPVTDALVIAGLVDGVLVVGNSGSTTKRGMKRAVELLRQVDAPLIGAIVNGVPWKGEYGYAYADNRYYRYRTKNGKGRPAENGEHATGKKPRVAR